VREQRLIYVCRLSK